MRDALVIGYGNPLRGDDGFGWHAAHRLAKLANYDGVHVLAVHQLTPELAELVSNAELVIFIDASHEGEPGTWRCEEIATEARLTNTLAHHFTPTILLAYARTVFHVSPPALIITLGVDSFDFCESLTLGAEAALPEVLQSVLGRILKYT
jgi:hydrogenase maturation protease